MQNIKTTNIYFIQSVTGGPIKIGISDDPFSRLNNLQTSHYTELRILLIIKNVRQWIETELHHFYKKYNIRGEWFDECVFKDRLQIEYIIEYESYTVCDIHERKRIEFEYLCDK